MTALRWIGLALLGIVVAAAVSVAASRLASKQIGLSSQPVSAGDTLAPASERGAGAARRRREHAQVRHRGGPHREALPPEEATPPVVPAPETEPVPPYRPPGEGGDGGDGEQGGGADD